MSAACCRRSAGRGLTLVEVIAGLVLLATLLASILVAFGSQAAQIRAARDRITAVELADRLLSEWSSQNAIPAVGTEQNLAGTNAWRWRIVAGQSAELALSGVSSVRVEVWRSKQTGADQVLAWAEVLVPGKSGAAH
jgi:type II secretory pathway pseudopilin PulG